MNAREGVGPLPSQGRRPLSQPMGGGHGGRAERHPGGRAVAVAVAGGEGVSS